MKTDTAIKNQWALSSFGIVREQDTHKAVCEMRLIDKDRWSDSNPQWAQNAELIVTAVNACKEINPDNPLNVAKAIPQLFEVLKEAYNKFSAFGFNWEGRNTTEGQFLLSQMRSVITDITE